MTQEELKDKQESRKFNLIVEMRLLKQQVEFFTNGTREYRDCLDKKFDKIFNWLEQLPCKERIEMSKGIAWQLKALWAIVGISFGTIIIEWFKK